MQAPDFPTDRDFDLTNCSISRIGGIGVFRDAIALVDECDPRCGACTTLIGAWLVGEIGGTGSLCAHTGVEISIHSKTGLWR